MLQAQNTIIGHRGTTRGTQAAFSSSQLKLLFADVKNWRDLDQLLSRITQQIGLDFYALDWVGCQPSAFTDQVIFRAQVHPPSSVPFFWNGSDESDVHPPEASGSTRQLRNKGVGDGLTIPFHTPDGDTGACHFAVEPERTFPEDESLIMVGLLACDAAHRLSQASPEQRHDAPRLTPRQLDCALLAARGMAEIAIARALNISDETVKRHLKQARQAYDVSKTIQLIAHCLHDGTITFAAALTNEKHREDASPWSWQRQGVDPGQHSRTQFTLA